MPKATSGSCRPSKIPGTIANRLTQPRKPSLNQSPGITNTCLACRFNYRTEGRDCMTAEHNRLEAARTQNIPWKKWGPYLSERQWGSVREDYSEGGNAWDYFSHDQARSRAYRWGEDGL